MITKREKYIVWDGLDDVRNGIKVNSFSEYAEACQNPPKKMQGKKWVGLQNIIWNSDGTYRVALIDQAFP